MTVAFGARGVSAVNSISAEISVSFYSKAVLVALFRVPRDKIYVDSLSDAS